MKKLLFVLLSFLLFSIVFSMDISSIDNFFDNYNDKSIIKSPPDTATNLYTYQFAYDMPINTPILLITISRAGNRRDTLDNRTIGFNVFEENRDTSYIFSTVFFDTTDYFHLNNGEVYYYIMNSDTEIVSIKAFDSTGVIKSSFPTIINFMERADTATGIRAIEDTFLTVNSAIRFFIQYVDDNGAIYPDFAPLMTDSTLRLTILDNADSSVEISAFDTSSFDVLYPPILNGGYYLQLSANRVRDIYILCEPMNGAISIPAETLHFVSVPESEARDFFVFSFKGFYQSIGKSKGLLAVNMGDNGPISSNNTSAIDIVSYDLTGKGVNVNPSNFILQSGVNQFFVSTDSINESIVLEFNDYSTPDLTKWNKYECIEFKPLYNAIMGIGYLPRVAFIGDTIDGEIRVTDGYENVDTTYNGFAFFSDYTMNMLNNTNAQLDEVVPINNGYGLFKAAYNFIDTAYCNFKDYESDGFLHSYYATNGFDGYRMNVIWLNSTNTTPDRLNIYLPENKTTTINHNEIISFAYLTGDSISKTNGTITVTCTGNANLSSSTVNLINGTASLFISDSTEEVVYITATDGIRYDVDTLYFIDENKAMYVVVAYDENVIVNEQFTINFYAFNANYNVDTTYNGVLTVLINDNNGDTSSFKCTQDMTSINFVNGIASADFYNTEAERIEFSGYSVSGTDTIYRDNNEVFSRYNVYCVADNFNYNGDTLYIRIIDYDSITANYNTQIDSINVVEENADLSYTIHSPYNPISITNGIGELIISDTESENLKIYGVYYDTLLENNYIEQLLFDLVPTGIVKPIVNEFYILSSKSLFNSEANIKFGIKKKSNVKINIYDQMGRHIKTLFNNQLNMGHYRIKWDGKDKNNENVSSGIYFIFMNIDNEILLKEKITKIK